MRCRSLFAWLLFVGSASMAVAAPVELSDCDDPAWQSVRQPGQDPSDARGVWVGAGAVRWPGVRLDLGEHLRLLHSAHGTASAVAGQRASGFDEGFELAPAADGDPGPDRWRYLPAGVQASLSAADETRVAGLLPGQWLLVRESSDGLVRESTRLQWAGLFDEALGAAATSVRYGAVAQRGLPTRFALWAPTARSVAVCVYPNGRGAATAQLPMRRDDASGAWEALAKADVSGQYYRFLVEVYVPGVGWVLNRVTDPYAVSLTTDSRRAYVADLGNLRLKPRGWDAHTAPDRVHTNTDMVVYETHVRDFSVNDSTVPAAHRGKFLAFTDTASRGMRHLRALAQAGLTDIHLLPVFDLATIPEAACIDPKVPAAPPDSEAQQAAVMAVASRDCFNWGYDPFHYSAPEGSYSTDPADGAARIREFRSMVLSLHRAGLRVGMDVVYNHTAAAGQSEHSVLDRIVPGYYHRLDATGRIEHSTCCENTATENLMMARLMIDSVKLWATQYRIDSFRFDLMAHQPRPVMEALQAEVDAAAGRHINLIGEGWNFGEVADGRRFVQASQRSLGGSGIGTFSDRGRDALRGGSAVDDGDALVRRKGWINGGAEGPREEALREADLARVGLAGTLSEYRMETAQCDVRRLQEIDYDGQPAGYASLPGEAVNYVENHDGLTLFDINVLKLPVTTTRHERARVQMLGAAMVMFSQGVAYFHAGIDILRSKSLDRNSFDSGDWFNRIDWTYRRNHFGTGLPPRADNERSWPLFRPLLADQAVAPDAKEIAWARDQFRDLLAIRASTALFHLRTADDVHRRLVFHNTGPGQDPAVIVGEIDGRDLKGAVFAKLIYLVNSSPETRHIPLQTEAGEPWVLHPVHRRRGATDRRAAEDARFDPVGGVFTIPGRTAAVFVQPAR